MKQSQNNPNLLNTKIISLNSLLQGIGTDTELTFRYTDIGDEVNFEKRGRGKNKFARVDSIIRANPYNPLCNHFANCGGCSAQHIEYARQLSTKTESIVEKFQMNYDFTFELIPAEIKYKYRNRMDFAVFPSFIGLRQAENFRRIIDVNKCELQSDWANQELLQMRNLITEIFSDLPLNRKSGMGFLKYITLRTNLNSSDTMTIFTFSEEFDYSEIKENFITELLTRSLATNIIFCYSRKQSEVSADGRYQVVKGKSFYTEDLYNKKLLIPFNSFFQPNPKGFTPIIHFIEHILKENKSSTLIDLFCGNGFFSFLFGDRFENLIGYDWVESSIKTAQENLTRIYPNKQITFEKKDLLQFKDVFLNSNDIFKDSIMILDPPRNGIGIKLSEYILESEISNIIYVSCNPNSQFNDMKILSQKYRIESGMITDPYPHTPHIESALFLKRINQLPNPV